MFLLDDTELVRRGRDIESVEVAECVVKMTNSVDKMHWIIPSGLAYQLPCVRRHTCSVAVLTGSLLPCAWDAHFLGACLE